MPPQLPIYLDNQATTRVDPRVVQAMLPYFDQLYGNPGSTTHPFGWEAKEAVRSARELIGSLLNAGPAEILFTSGATESNNLAIFGVARRRADKPRIISVCTEHRAVLDPIRQLAREGRRVTLLAVEPADAPDAGRLNPQRLAEAITPDTALVSIMPANNEIGTLNDLPTLAAICHQHGVPLHADATQWIGKLPVDLQACGADLVSFTAHKFHGPKGTGALYLRRGETPLRLNPWQFGGGQEQGLRSGTLNTPGIVGLAAALRLSVDELPTEVPRLRMLRDQLFNGIRQALPDTLLNGPILECPDQRLPGNLNITFPGVHGESLIMKMRDIAVSSGSACTSANPEPSHVLRALGRNEDLTRASIRFGLGRFNTDEEIDYTIDCVVRAVRELRG